MKRSWIFNICCLLLLPTLSVAQHNAMFSEYMFNYLVLNPAYAGSHDVLRLTLTGRDQWVGFSGAPQTFTFCADSPLKNKHVNLGAIFMNDRIGITSQNSVNMIFAYRIHTGDKALLSFGIQGGLNDVHNDWSKITTNDQGDQVFPNANDQQELIPEAGFGVYFNIPKFYAGFSIPTLLADNPVDDKSGGLSYKTCMFDAGGLFNVSSDVTIKPSFLVKYIENSPMEEDINATVYLKNLLGIGVSYRTKDAMVFMLSYHVNKQFEIGYAYDMTLSELSKYSSGTHEIMLKYEFGYEVVAKSPRYF